MKILPRPFSVLLALAGFDEITATDVPTRYLGNWGWGPMGVYKRNANVRPGGSMAIAQEANKFLASALSVAVPIRALWTMPNVDRDSWCRAVFDMDIPGSMLGTVNAAARSAIIPDSTACAYRETIENGGERMDYAPMWRVFDVIGYQTKCDDSNTIKFSKLRELFDVIGYQTKC